MVMASEARDLAPYVDAVFPSLYTLSRDSAAWEAYATMELQAARQFNKPVYCFLWPQYYSHGQRGPYLDRAYWRLELDTCYKYADGIVLYDEPGDRSWDPGAPWWQETLSFVNSLSESQAEANSLTVVAPNGGESWARGTTHSIQWRYSGLAGSEKIQLFTTVKVQLYKGFVVQSNLSTSTPVGSGGVGSFTWTINPALPAGSDYRIRVTSTSDGKITDSSDANFSLH